MRNLIYTLVFLITLLAVQAAYSQIPKKIQYCGVTDNRKYISEEALKNTQEERQEVGNTGGRLSNPSGTIVIPVVFHILYHPSIPAQNVAEESLDLQLITTNQDLSGTNPDIGAVPSIWAGIKGNMKVQLKRACIDPNGNPTNGIVRKQLANPTQFPQVLGYGGILPGLQLTSMGGDDAWPTDKYLNIWIADIRLWDLGFLLGWGMSPMMRLNSSTFVDNNGNTLTMPNSVFDGIALNYSCFPEDPNEPIPLNLPYRILTHEAGHWLGLYHLSEGGCSPGDEVGDTPPQATEPNGCPSFPLLEVPNPLVPSSACTTTPPGIMFMNFMNPRIDNWCMRFFTQGQVQRCRDKYFAPSGYIGTRFPFIENYFGIKEPFTLQNNTLTVYLNNPACIDVNYSFTGPVTEVSHDNQKIVFSVACPSSGNVTVTAIAGNYEDDYSFTYDNQINCNNGVWPKVYKTGDGVSGSGLFKLPDGNILLSTTGAEINSSSYNHIGMFPPPNWYEVPLIHYTDAGVTNWLGDFHVAFVLQSGVVQSTTGTNFYNGNDGTSVPSPINSQSGECIIAETSDGYRITNEYQYTSLQQYLQLRLYSPSGILLQELLPIPRNSLPIFRYNRQTNDMFIILVGALQKYHFDGSGLSLILSKTTNLPIYNGFVTINDQNELCFVDSDNILKKYDYLNNLADFTIPVAIAGFNNCDIYTCFDSGWETNNKCIVNNSSFYYYIDFGNNTYKSISATPNAYWVRYMFSNNYVYFEGSPDYDFHIGNQYLPYPSYFEMVPIFITRFNLQTDFQRIGQESEKQTIVNEASKLVVSLTPNPVFSVLKCNIVNYSKIASDVAGYSLQITGQTGMVMLQKNNYSSGSDINISSLQSGVYFITVTGLKGEKGSAIFTKL